MISFKQFLNESKSAPLYHGTALAFANSILKDDILKAVRTHGGLTPMRRGKEVNAVSLTRSLKTGIWWARQYDYGGVVFELDQKKLANNYKINPIEIVNLWRMRDGHPVKNAKDSGLFEEYIDRDIKNISRYIKAIHINEKALKVVHNLPRIYNHPLLYNHESKQWVNK